MEPSVEQDQETEHRRRNTELLNRDLELEDQPFQTKEVAEWLRNTGNTTFTLCWSRTRPRR
jgi:hypothetical protein